MTSSITDAVRHWRTPRLATTAGYFVAFVALGLGYASLGPTLTDLATHVGANLTNTSHVFLAKGLGYLIGSLIGGRLYDRVKAHPVLVTMLVMTAVLMAIVPIVPVLWLLVGAIFLLAVFQGGLDVGGNTLLVWIHGEGVDPYMNALHFFFGVGAFVSPLIIAQAVLITGGVRWAYWALALLILPVAAGIARLPSPIPPSDRTDAPSDLGAAGARSGSGSRFSPRRDISFVVLVALFFCLYVGAEASFGGWIATYAKATGVGDSATAAYLTSVFWGALTAGRLLSIPLAARFSPRQVLLTDLLVCFGSVLALFIWPGSAVATWIGTFGAGLGMASIFPTTLSLAERNMTITGAVTSWFFVGGSLGGMSLPWLIGQLFESRGPGVTVLAMVTAVALAMVVFGMIVLHIRRKEVD